MMMYSMMRCMMNEWYSNVVQCMYVVHMYRVPGMWYRVQGVPGIFNCVQCSVHHTLVVPGTRVLLPGMNVDLWSVVVCAQQGVVPVQKIKQMDWKGIASTIHIHMYFSKSQEVTGVQKLKIYVCTRRCTQSCNRAHFDALLSSHSALPSSSSVSKSLSVSLP